MTLDKVYVVCAIRVGDYSDRSEWDVAAYPDRETAEQHAALANEYDLEVDVQETYLKASPYDRHRGNESGYEVASYGVIELPLVLHVDQYQERSGE